MRRPGARSAASFDVAELGVGEREQAGTRCGNAGPGSSQAFRKGVGRAGGFAEGVLSQSPNALVFQKHRAVAEAQNQAGLGAPEAG